MVAYSSTNTGLVSVSFPSTVLMGLSVNSSAIMTLTLDTPVVSLGPKRTHLITLVDTEIQDHI